MSLVLLLGLSAVASEEPGMTAVESFQAAELIDKGRLAGLGLGEQACLEVVSCVGALGVGVVSSRGRSSKPASAYERFKEAGEDIGGVRTLMEVTCDAARCWGLLCHNILFQGS